MKDRQFLMGSAGAATLQRTDAPPGVAPLPPGASAEKRPAAARAVPETIREHNPLLFDFVLRRQLRPGDPRFAPGVFETRSFFDRKIA